MKKIKIPEECFSKWKISDTPESFVFWSLKNKFLPRKQYFDWAMEYYQMPFLEEMFFEQQIIAEKQWIKVKDLTHWMPELVPVALWDDVVFIGCVDPHFKKTDFKFSHRFVLSSSRTLELTWNLTRTLSKEITKNKEVTHSSLISEVYSKNQSKDEVFSKSLDEEKFSSNKPSVFIQTMKINKESGKMDSLPLQKEASMPFTDNKREVQIQEYKVLQKKPLLNQNKEKSAPSFKVLNRKEELQIQKSEPLKEKNPFNQTKTLSLAFENSNTTNSNVTLGEDHSKSLNKTVSHTQVTRTSGVHIKEKFDKKHENLWQQTRSFFVASMVLKVKEDKIYPLAWQGQITIKDTKELANLNGYSLFKVVKRGLSYHGFVVDNQDNKKFFHKIGWEKYPQHVTAAPIKNEQQKLTQIFIGLGLQHFSKEKIKSIEKVISHFFQSQVQKISKAA